MNENLIWVTILIESGFILVQFWTIYEELFFVLYDLYFFYLFIFWDEIFFCCWSCSLNLSPQTSTHLTRGELPIAIPPTR